MAAGLLLLPGLAYSEGCREVSGVSRRMDRVVQGLVWSGRVFVLALAYAAMAHLAYLVASPGTFAAAVFPPAGIALAAILIWGWQISPGVFLGSLALNLTLGHTPFAVDFSQLPVALGIAVGATLQALAGGYLCRRLSALPVVAQSSWHELRVVLMGGGSGVRDFRRHWHLHAGGRRT